MDEYQWREAGAADAERIAELHVRSWRATYRAVMSEAYLAGPIDAERLAVWRERLGLPSPLRTVWLLEQAGELRGFACLELETDPHWGVFLDNLHAAPDQHGRGLGRALMRKAAQWALAQRPQEGMYLWVYAGNPNARAFYEYLGGLCVEDTLKETPDGGSAVTHRMAWAPAALRALAATA